MINTGIIRRVDDLGRIVMPKEVRRLLDVKEGDAFEISVDPKNGSVTFKKYEAVFDRTQRLAKEQGKPCHEFFGCALSFSEGRVKCNGDCAAALLRNKL